MAAYDSYKDSGVKWLGKVPSHWEITKMRAHFSERKQFSKFGKETLLSVSEYSGITPSINEYGEIISRSESLEGYKICNASDLVINIMLAWKRGLGISQFNGIVSPAYCVFETHNINPSYANYLLRTDTFIAEFKRNSTGIIESRLRLYPSEFKNIQCLCPPQEEQEAIVSYLDNVTAKIDEAIEAQQKMIDALNERKQIIITRAVTRNMDKWYKIPLRFVFEMRNGYTPSKADPSFWENGTIPWYRMEDIRKSGRFLNESIQTISPKAVKSKGTFKAGSYIMAICTASIGEHAMLIADSLANQQFMNFKVHKSLINELSPKFIFYYFYVIGKFCRDNANSTCFQYVDMAALKRYPIPVPSIAEQQDIVTYIEQATSAIDSSLSATEHRLNLLQERKQIIINEVVTGKKKVI